MGALITTAEEVQEYIAQTDDPNMNKRLYVEVRYAKNTSLRLKHTDPIFRLKRNGKNLVNEEYVENLTSYLGSARKTSTISVNDLENAICKITTGSQMKDLPNEEMAPAVTNESSIKPGEHCCSLLEEGKQYCVVSWHSK